MKLFKKIRQAAALVLVASFLALTPGLLSVFPATALNDGTTVDKNAEFRGTWVSTVVNLDWPSSRNLTNAQLMQEAITYLDKAKQAGLNAIILQVRPSGDAFYKSALFPWSYYLTGSQGKAPADGFDPLAFWIKEAHARGLQLHAWVNPFRITMGTPAAPKTNVNELAATNPARLHPDWTVAHTDGRLYFNPGIPAARQLVVDGVAELVRNYDIDGVHFDDYFYPGATFNDNAAFAADSRGFKNKDDWRRDNIDLLIKATYDAVKAIKPNVNFGVSPAGVWANVASNALGSNTRGYQTYYACYADTRKWVKNNWLDYIAPQIYWEQGNSAADYTTLLKWWSDVVQGTNVKLYIGHAAYRIDGASSLTAWRTQGELLSQLWLNRRTPNVSGSIFFRAASILNNPVVMDSLKGFYDGTGSKLPPNIGAGTLAVNRPMQNVTINTSEYFLMGTSDPAKPLTVNGKPITNRSPSGLFGYKVSLANGANTFVLEQDGTKVARVITRGTPAGTASYPFAETPAIVSGSEYPMINDKVYRSPAQTITLQCNAPIGSTVTASFLGKTYALAPAATTLPLNDGKLYTTSYKHTVTLDAYASAPKGAVYELGCPVYTMNYNGVVQSVTAGMPHVIVGGADVGLTVKDATNAKLYATADTSSGAVAELPAGMRDSAAYVGGGWLKLGSGYFVFVDSVDVYPINKPYRDAITGAAYVITPKTEDFTLSLQGIPSAVAQYSITNRTLTYKVYDVDSAPTFAVPQESIFSAVTASYDAATSTASYVFKLKNTKSVDGYYTEVTPGAVTLHIKQRPKNTDGTLAGITIMLDPGHGGSAGGATGAFGSIYQEKDITLDISKKLQTKLEALGATVVMTRDTDVFLTLYSDRLDISRTMKPDMFLSIHCNSMGEGFDGNTVAGAASFYHYNNSMLFAQQLYSDYTGNLCLGKKGCRAENFVVCNGFWAPHVLLETGFINNPVECEWLCSADGQDRISSVVANSILKYFS